MASYRLEASRFISSIAGTIIILILLSSFVALAYLVQWRDNTTLTISIDEKNIKLYIHGKPLSLATVNSSYAVITEAIGVAPTGYMLRKAVILPKGFNHYDMKVDLTGLIHAWKEYYTAYPPESFIVANESTPLPNIHIILAVCMDNGTIYIGGYGIDIYDMLVSIIGDPYKAYKIVEKHPFHLLEMMSYRIGLNLNITLERYNIDKAIHDAMSLLGYGPISESIQEAKKIGSGVYAKPYLPGLYRSRNNPPGQWFDRIRTPSGDSAPPSIIKRVWRGFASLFSQEYFFDKKLWSLDQAIRYVLGGINDLQLDEQSLMITTMTDLLHRIEPETADYLWWSNPVNETILAPFIAVRGWFNENMSIGPLTDYPFTLLSFPPYNTWTGIDLMGLTLYGSVLMPPYMRHYAFCVSKGDEFEALLIPIRLVSQARGEWLMHPDDLVVILPDTRSINGYWAVKPILLVIPYIALVLPDYAHMVIVRDPEYYGVIQHNNLLVTENLTVCNMIINSSFQDPIMKIDLWSNNPYLQDYSASLTIIPPSLLCGDLYWLGLTSREYKDLSGLVGAGRSNGGLERYASFTALLSGEALHITYYSAYAPSIIAELAGFSMISKDMHVELRIVVNMDTLKYTDGLYGYYPLEGLVTINATQLNMTNT